MQDKEEESVQQVKETKQIVKQIHDRIISKICNIIVYSNEDFKIFADILQTKDDIKRLIKEKKFVASLRSNTISYEQPKISPTKSSNSPLKFNNKQQQQQLSAKAKNFIIQIKKNKKIFQGKTYILKRTQVQKKREQQRKKQLEQQVQKQVNKNIRRIKAQKNVQFFNKKKKIQQRLSRPGSPIKRKLSVLSSQQGQKSIKLPSLHSSLQLQQIKQEEENIPIGLKKTVRKQNNKRMRSLQIPRSLTPSSSFSMEVKLFQQTKGKDKLNSVRTNKTLRHDYKGPEQSQRVRYLMKRQRGNQIQQYLQNYTNLNQFVESKTNINHDLKKSIKQMIKQRHLNKQSVRSSISFIDLDDDSQLIQQEENQLQ